MGDDLRRGVPREAPSLTTELVVSTALAVGQRDGFETLTMRSLARALGVTPMAIYHHVAGKRELLQLVVDEAFGDVEPVPPRLDDWGDRLAGMMSRDAAVFDRYPGLDTVIFQFEPSPKMSMIIDGYVQVLCEAGFSEHRARLGFGVLHAMSLGRLLMERRAGQLGTDADEMSSAGPQHPSGETESRREFAADVLVRGLKSILGDPPTAADQARQTD